MIIMKSKTLLSISLILFAFGFGLYIYYSTAFRDFHPVIDDQPKLDYPSNMPQGRINATLISAFDEVENISINLFSLQQNTIVKFFDPSNNLKLPLIAYLTPRGKIVTAVSVSENCTSQDFYIEGNNIYCSNCPSYWNMESLEAYSCCQRFYPDPIPSKLIDSKIVIAKNILADWQKRE